MGKKRLLVACLALLLGLAAAGCQSEELPAKPTPTAAPAAQGGGMPASSRIIAGARVVPARSAELAFAGGGIVRQLSVRPGDKVSQGQNLAQLDAGLLEQQLALAEANLSGAQAKLDQFDRGPATADVTAAGQALAAAQAFHDRLSAGPDPSELAAATAALTASEELYQQVRAGPNTNELAQLRAQAENARSALQQAQATYDQVRMSANVAMLPQSVALQQATNNHAAAVAAYERAAAHPTASELAAAAAQVQAARAALDRLTPRPDQLQAALAAVMNARAQLAGLQSPADERAVLQAGLAAARAGRDLAAAQLRQAALEAPFAGSVVKLNLSVGEYAAPGEIVVVLADASAWEVETTDLTELSVAEVAEGARVSLVLDAIPGLQLSGRVTSIDRYGETRQGDIVYTVHIGLDRQDARLRWNMTTKATITSR